MQEVERQMHQMHQIVREMAPKTMRTRLDALWKGMEKEPYTVGVATMSVLRDAIQADDFSAFIQGFMVAVVMARCLRNSQKFADSIDDFIDLWQHPGSMATFGVKQ